jgi:hypothetical protein
VRNQLQYRSGAALKEDMADALEANEVRTENPYVVDQIAKILASIPRADWAIAFSVMRRIKKSEWFHR